MSKSLAAEWKFAAHERSISDVEKKSFAAIYHRRENPTLLSKHAKNLPGFTRREVHVFREKDTDVKKISVRILLALALLIGFGVTPVLADGGSPSPPSCRPPLICMAR